MMRKLKLFNGRWMDSREDRSYVQHAFVAAYSLADAARVITECLGYEPRGLIGELRNYWNRDAWGNSMDGITPERGLWVSRAKYGGKSEKPVRVLSRAL